MKVIYVLHSHRAGGAEQHLLHLMKGVAAQGVEPIFAGPLDGWLGERVAEAGIRHLHVPYRGIYDLASVLRLAALARREKAALIHGHLTRGALYAGLAARLARTPNLATAHSTNAGKHFGRADGIIAVCDAVHRFLLASGYRAERLRTIHNGVPDLSRGPRASREELMREFGIEHGPVIAMVARFVPDKGHDLALKALAKLADQPWTLLCAGATDTPWATEMQALAGSLGIAGRVRFVGHQQDATRIYALADLLLAPSRREAFSLTLLEAACFSLPVVAADVGGISEAVVDHHSGRLVPAEDIAMLSAAIDALLRSEATRGALGKAARELYAANFSTDTMCARTLAFYHELTADGARR